MNESNMPDYNQRTRLKPRFVWLAQHYPSVLRRMHGLMAGGRYRLEVVDHSEGTCEAYRPHSDSGAGPGRSRPAMDHVQPGAKAGRERLKVEAAVVTLGAAQETLGATY